MNSYQACIAFLMEFDSIEQVPDDPEDLSNMLNMYSMQQFHTCYFTTRAQEVFNAMKTDNPDCLYILSGANDKSCIYRGGELIYDPTDDSHPGIESPDSNGTLWVTVLQMGIGYSPMLDKVMEDIDELEEDSSLSIFALIMLGLLLGMFFGWAFFQSLLEKS